MGAKKFHGAESPSTGADRLIRCSPVVEMQSVPEDEKSPYFSYFATWHNKDLVLSISADLTASKKLPKFAASHCASKSRDFARVP